MLKEHAVSQKEAGTFRRWFQDDYFDLIVWYETKNRSMTGFQLCYNKQFDEHALTWHAGTGFSHHAVDDSRSAHKHPASPILVDDGAFPFEEIIARFREASVAIDSAARDLVISRLEEYSKGR